MYSEKDISAIKYAIEQNLLGDNVLEKIEMSKRQDLLKKHIETVCKIEQMQGKDTRYYTYVWIDAEHKKKKYFKHKKKEDVEQDVVNFYKEKEKLEQVTLFLIYDEWLNYKMLQSNSNNNAQRLHAEWKKYYKNDEIIHKPLADMDTIYLETWALKKIEDYQFKRRQYNNMVTVIRQMLDYCQKKGIVEKNNFKSFTINNKKFVKAEKKINANEIFFKDEQTEVEALAYKDYEETGNVECLAVCLNFYLGLRLGELVTLKITDFNQSENFVKVERTEIKKYKKIGDEFVVDGTEVQEYLKCGKDERCVYYPDKVNSIVNIIIAAIEEKGFTNMKYLFISKDGQRVGERAVDIRLRKYCKYAKINARGIHKTRKTYISTLLERGMSPNMVKEQAGHADIQTTFNNYYFSLTKDTEKAKQLNKIFDKME